MLSAAEYRTRRSVTLRDNPDAILDEKREIQAYFKTQAARYTARIRRLAKLDRPMAPACRMVVTIPAYNEGTRIKHALEQYARQAINPALFEIVVAVYPLANDSTSSEITQFQNEHPEISVRAVELVPGEDEPVTVGLNRKFAADVALARILSRRGGEKDSILIINDADSQALADTYLADILNKFDEDPQVDALATAMTLPPEAMAKPNVAAAYLITDTFERAFAKGEVGENKEAILEPALIAASSATRASIYAAVGGFNPRAVIGENWELGWLIADARDWNPGRIIYFDKTFLATDPRRIIDAVAHRVPADQGLLEFESNLELRQLDSAAVLDLIPDQFDFELFQDDVDSLWRSQRTGSNIRIGERRFALLFEATMRELGVQYRLDDTGGVAVVNVDGLIKRLAGGGAAIDIIHSQPRVYTPQMIERNRSVFATFPAGSMDVRNKKAEAIAAEIRLVQSRGEVERLPGLLTSYERFARHEYRAPSNEQ